MDDIEKTAKVAAPAPAPAAPPRLAAETWAERKGMYPHFVDPSPTNQVLGSSPRDPMGNVALGLAGVPGPKLNGNYWKFAAARAMSNWPTGKELTEADFDAAIAAACSVRSG